MSNLDLDRIKDTSLNAFKDNAPDPRKAGHFLTECWVNAVVSELNRLGYISLVIKKDHQHLVKD